MNRKERERERERVIPVPKYKEPLESKDLCPVCILPILCKVVKKCVEDQPQRYIKR